MSQDHDEKKRLNRRRFLTGLGLGTAGLMLPSLGWRPGGGSVAGAQDSIPKRFVLVWTAHGTVRENWKMDQPGLPTDRDTEFALGGLAESDMSPILQPLHRHREKLLVLEGIAQTSTLADAVANNHYAARSHLLTGAPFRGSDIVRPTAKSIDQHIADAVRREGRFASLEVGTNNESITTRDGGEVVPVQTNPGAAFDMLFPPDAMEAEPTAEDVVRGERGSVLDFAQAEYDAVLPRLSGDDRRKLEQHRDMVRDLETRIASLATVTCGRPELMASEAEFEHFSRIAAAALACDLTRVVSIQMRQLSTSEFGAPGGDVHQDYAHAATPANPDAMHWMTEYNLHHAREIAFLLDLLDSVPEGDGTLLDNTCFIWLTEMATGTHELRDIPVVMAGGCQGEFRTGRYVRYAQNRPMPVRPWGPYPDVGPAHSKLLISLAQMMGVDLSALPMETAPAEAGGTIDLTGPLEGLS